MHEVVVSGRGAKCHLLAKNDRHEVPARADDPFVRGARDRDLTDERHRAKPAVLKTCLSSRAGSRRNASAGVVSSKRLRHH